jgi:hypothetical protein
LLVYHHCLKKCSFFVFAGLYSLFLSKNNLINSWCRRSSWLSLSTFQVTSLTNVMFMMTWNWAKAK